MGSPDAVGVIAECLLTGSRREVTEMARPVGERTSFSCTKPELKAFFPAPVSADCQLEGQGELEGTHVAEGACSRRTRGRRDGSARRP